MAHGPGLHLNCRRGWKLGGRGRRLVIVQLTLLSLQGGIVGPELVSYPFDGLHSLLEELPGAITPGARQISPIDATWAGRILRLCTLLRGELKTVGHLCEL